MSKSKRNWKPEHLEKVVKKVNEHKMAGNLGHPLLDPKAYERDFPLPQVVWAVASISSVGGKSVARFKGYVLKSSKAREYLKLGLIDGVSIFGDSRMRPVQGGYDVISFEPETIDFARKGRSGMTSRIVNLTGEQETKGGTTVEPKDIAALSPDEIRTHAPLVFAHIQTEARTELTEKVGEMEGVITAAKPELDILGEIKKLLKLSDGENPIEKLTNLLETIEGTAKSEIKAFVNELVGKKVKTDRGKALLRRLIGEMENDYEGELDDSMKKKIEDDFEAKIEGSDEIKQLVGEMATWNDEGNNSDRGSRRGGSSFSARSRVGADHREADGEERRGGLKIVKRKLSEVG